MRRRISRKPQNSSGHARLQRMCESSGLIGHVTRADLRWRPPKLGPRFDHHWRKLSRSGRRTFPITPLYGKEGASQLSTVLAFKNPKHASQRVINGKVDPPRRISNLER